MNKLYQSVAAFTVVLMLAHCSPALAQSSKSSHGKQGSEIQSKVAIVLHGGAGIILEKNFTPELEQEYRDTLRMALDLGYALLLKGESSVDAVKAAIVYLEDSPLFNAGKGAVFTHKGRNSLDASIMKGDDLSAGTLAGVNHVKNPILLADKIRTDSVHVMMSAEGAEEFAQEHNIDRGFPRMTRIILSTVL